MPIHLPPVSRRDFFKHGFLAAAGLALPANLLAARKRTDPNSWALLADTHVAADAGRIVRGINMASHLQRTAAEVLALPGRPAGVFILGDCAFYSGEREDYATLTDLLNPLRADGVALHLALGNHDQREHFWSVLEAKKAARRPVRERHVALLRTPQVNWFMLDSLETTLQTPGALGTAQLNWLAKSLDANRQRPALVVLHHHPGNSGSVGGLKDTERLLEIIRPRRQVKAWICGHTHRWSVTADESGVHLVNLPPVAYVFQPANPSGWVHATVRRDGMDLELRGMDATHQSHGQVVVLKWREG